MGISVYTKIAIFSLALMVSAGVFAMLQVFEDPVVVQNTRVDKGLQVVRDTVTQADTDSDGLHDWEETLWGTDPRNPDTDGDGEFDGAEVLANRNPRIAGPDDSLGTDMGAQIGSAATNTTDRVAQDFFGQYIALKQQGVAIDEDTQTQLAASVVESIPEVATEDVYTITDLELLSDDSGQAIQVYGNTIGEILSRHTPKSTAHELDIFANALSREDETILKQLDPIIAGYAGIIQDVATMPVPVSASKVHVAFLNELVRMHMVISKMRGVYDDPMQTLSVMGQYEMYLSNFSTSLDNLARYVISKGVRFTPSDPGYFLTTI